MKKLCIFLTFLLLFAVTSTVAHAKFELTFWTHEDPNRTEIENRYIKEFEKANPGVTVKRVTSPSKKNQSIEENGGKNSHCFCSEPGT
jgi:multiple sugar transport system substrate-binding protein